ncbi:finTRIM family, member 67 [Garra rufa]|uniref:finTRIM family, member 67 n=1 Tax=Garra rufa TaxID=137080 RepID=UPI003CCEBB0A
MRCAPHLLFFKRRKLSAQSALEESERIFTELVCSIERRRAEVKELIRGQERAAVSQAEALLQQLEQEITELKKRHGELGELSQTEDHIAFLQNCRSLCAQPVPVDLPNITSDPNFGSAMTALTEFQALLEDVCQGGFVDISEKVNHVTIIESTKPKTESESNAASASVFGPPVQNQFSISVPTISVFPFSSFGSRTSGPRQRLQPRRRRR